MGGAAATGDGDVMLRFLPAFVAVEAMRRGDTPAAAAEAAVRRIAERQPEFSGAVVALSSVGVHGAACHGMDEFPYSVAGGETGGKAQIVTVPCVKYERRTPACP